MRVYTSTNPLRVGRSPPTESSACHSSLYVLVRRATSFRLLRLALKGSASMGLVALFTWKNWRVQLACWVMASKVQHRERT